MKSLVLLSLLVSSTVLAAAPGVRNARQDARIKHGVVTGQLTAREAVRLKARQEHLERRAQRARLDGGGMTAGEAARLNRAQDRLSRDIYRQKHDAQVR